jgi:CheY-like chemotaxis protein
MTTTKPYSILITDDDPGCRQALRDIFEPEGFRTFLASSGEEAIDIVKVEVVHVALLDMHMPRLTGLETIELARQYNRDLQCILVTADNDETLLRQAFRARVYSVVPKPISRSVILYTVTRALVKVPGEGDRHQPSLNDSKLPKSERPLDT